MTASTPLIDIPDDALLAEFMALFREYRDEGKLEEGDRQRFRAISAELRRRGVLKAPF